MALLILVTLISLATSTDIDSFGPFCWDTTCYTSTSACSSIGGSTNDLDYWCFVESGKYSLLGPFCYSFGSTNQCWTSSASSACYSNRIGGHAIGPYCLAPIGSETYQAFGPFCKGYGSSYTCYSSDTYSVCNELGGIYIGGSVGVWCILDSNKYKTLGKYCYYQTNYGQVCPDTYSGIECNKLGGYSIGDGKWCILDISDDFPGFGTSTTQSGDGSTTTDQSGASDNGLTSDDQSEVDTWKDIAIGLICVAVLQLAGCMIAGGYFYCGKRANKEEKTQPHFELHPVNNNGKAQEILQSDQVMRVQFNNKDENSRELLESGQVKKEWKADQVMRMRFNNKDGSTGQVNKDWKADQVMRVRFNNNDGNSRELLQSGQVNEDWKADQVMRMRFN